MSDSSKRPPEADESEKIHILESSPETTDDLNPEKPVSDQFSHRHRKHISSPGHSLHSDDIEEPQLYAYYNTVFDSEENAKKDESSENSLSGVTPAQRDKLREQKNSGHINLNFSKSFEASIKGSSELSCLKGKYGLNQPESIGERVKKTLRSRCACNLNCFLSFIKTVLPVISWIPQYKLSYLLPDAIAGFTVAVLHIPQGMAYGTLASLKPENGLYVSFFPVLIYFFLGTSRHISIGTFAVISIMVSSSVENIVGDVHAKVNATAENSTDTGSTSDPTHLEVATCLALVVGFWQLFMGIFKLGALSIVLSDHLVSGYTTAAAFHVATSQLPDLFGIAINRYNGPLKLVYMYRDIFTTLYMTNFATLILSAVAIFILAGTKEQINERFRDRLKMPIPIDIIVVIVATTFSYVLDLNGHYNVKIMRYIPTGFPEPTVPRTDLIFQVIADAFAIAIVIFAISLSMAKIFAKKHQYEVDANQELIALGCANVFSSFFSCYPCSASLSRSSLQERTGGKTQVVSIVSCCILLLVMLVLASLFFTLPKCILSATILVALKSMFLQVKDFKKAWRISKVDAFIWLVTLICTILLDITYGLLAGVVFAILTVIVRTVAPLKTFFGNVPGTDLYLDIRRYSKAKEVKGVKIFHFESALYFMNKEIFRDYLYKYVPVNSRQANEETCIKSCSEHIHHIVIDCSSFSYVDASGMETLLEVIKEYNDGGITVVLAGCSVSLYDMMSRANFFDDVPRSPSIFMTVHEAVKFCCRS